MGGTLKWDRKAQDLETHLPLGIQESLPLLDITQGGPHEKGVVWARVVKPSPIARHLSPCRVWAKGAATTLLPRLTRLTLTRHA